MYRQPKPESVVYPHIRVFVPYTTLQPATRTSLNGLNYIPVETVGETGYSDYFRERWNDKETFINVEGDIVVWPGAIKQLWDCPRDWCMYDFHLPCHWDRNLEHEHVGVPIGCVKISKHAIEQTPNIWEKPVEWFMCEQQITKQLWEAGITPHQHHPGVVNANPELLKLLGDEI